MVVPDTQVKPGVPTNHIAAAGRYAAEKKPEVIVLLGDWWDMPSLSAWDSDAKKAVNNVNYEADIAAGRKAIDEFLRPIRAIRSYRPELHFCVGNHCHRITRYVDDNPILKGTLGLHSLGLRERGFKVHPFLEIAKIDGIAYCMHPKHRVLTADLRYVPLGDIRQGDKIIGFDEHSQGHRLPRRYKTATVELVDPDTAELYRVSLRNGKQFDVTADHLWLARRSNATGWNWVPTKDLLRSSRTEVCHAMPEWEQEHSWGAGWLAGILDGEGHLSKPNGKQGGIQIGFGQNKGTVLTLAGSIMDSMGIEYMNHSQDGKDCQQVRIKGQSGYKLAALGRLRPVRLIEKFKPEMLGRVQHFAPFLSAVVEAVEPIGSGDIIKIKTSTGTMIIEGYAHHNCHYFCMDANGRVMNSKRGQASAKAQVQNVGMSATAGHKQGLDIHIKESPAGRRIGLICGSFYQHSEEYLSPQGNAHWSGIVVKHEVSNGAYDPMFVSLDFLLRRYT